MEENDLRAALRAYVTTDEPPIGLAESTVVRAGKRAKRRHAFAAIGSAVVLIVAMVTGGAIVLPKLHSTVPVAEHPIELATKAPCPENRADETDEEGRVRLTCVLSFLLRQFFPSNVRLEREWEGQTWPPGDDPLALNVGNLGFGASYALHLNIIDEQGLASIIVEIRQGNPHRGGLPGWCSLGQGIDPECEERVGPRNGNLVFTRSRSGQDALYLRATFETDDTYVSMTSGNAKESNFLHSNLPPSRVMPYFDHRQMEAIITAPDLVY
ncbi:hypothetical protein SAMN05421504_103725 [Amycolatopsis xylanica]|uniref:Uncharacterized protein n=1 Tax=Amycolatopsis xylanica TaxID=589385 RepID=A0A1H3EAR3_9PSEU|nr:hypothetical protein [Amycolatopsis xylanica]SDX75697.1 hypothetical protein SAMN05421504_103725 [Amycolatopsis xylanica]